MRRVKVNLGRRSYNILIDKGLIARAGRIIKSLDIAKGCYIITNRKIKSLYGRSLQDSITASGMDAAFCVVADSEKAKSNTSWYKVLKSLARFDKGKGVCVLALGGGVVGDLAGFVASTYRRGVPFIQVPTTLLAQVDSAIGGKVAIDTDFAKNLIGSFYQPKAVLSDISALKSLPQRQLRNGLSEVIKYAVILDKKLFSFLEANLAKVLAHHTVCTEHIICRCSRLKAEVVSADEEEKGGYRSILNFGHTIGHAIEAASSYKKAVNHGEAVAVGMLCAYDIAVNLRMAKDSSAKRLEALIKRAGLPVDIRGVSSSKVASAIAYDKKILKGKRRWVLPRAIGHVAVCSNVPAHMVDKAICRRVC